MKIEKLDKDNIKEYIRDMKITDISNVEENVGKLNEFGIKKDDKFLVFFFRIIVFVLVLVIIR